jgi:uncharacterized protein
MEMPNRPPFASLPVNIQLILFMALAIISVIMFSGIGLAAASFLYGVDVFSLSDVVNNLHVRENIEALKIIQALQAIGLFIIPPIVFSFLVSDKPAGFLMLDKKLSLQFSFSAVFLMLLALPLINWMLELNAHLKLPESLAAIESWMKSSELQAEKITKALLDIHTANDIISVLLVVAVIPAIGEELLFRGILQKMFSKWSGNIHAGVWISAAIFSAFHMQFFGFLPRLMIGALLGYMLAWSGSLWLPILAHFANNASAIVLTFLFNKGVISLDADKIGTEENQLQTLLPSVIATGIFIFYLYNRREREKKEIRTGTESPQS